MLSSISPNIKANDAQKKSKERSNEQLGARRSLATYVATQGYEVGQNLKEEDGAKGHDILRPHHPHECRAGMLRRGFRRRSGF